MNVVKKDDDEVCRPDGNDDSNDYEYNKYTYVVKKFMFVTEVRG